MRFYALDAPPGYPIAIDDVFRSRTFPYEGKEYRVCGFMCGAKETRPSVVRAVVVGEDDGRVLFFSPVSLMSPAWEKVSQVTSAVGQK